jgi:hypothetical protein
MIMSLPSSYGLSFFSLCPSRLLRLAKKALYAWTYPDFCRSLWQGCLKNQDLQGVNVFQERFFLVYFCRASIILEGFVIRQCLQELKGQSLDFQLAGRQRKSPVF